ncbi:HIT domain-containing protein [Arthrobacter sp. JZ12]|uniref:HIT family protein n=1 Tax=Arthrobacter sp. JZ12 TaxID=2654190 RepID=UPI002B482E00|nr:HIT family protein [Arthrobacter sp. JZ12]WRH25699.1 HIT domain-containing protein [Arthrobacter sp. JZ12]
MTWVHHAPDGYECPFCDLASGEFRFASNLCEPGDLIYSDDLVLAFIASHGFEPHPGHVLVTPRAHYELLYELPDDVAGRIMTVSRDMAIAIKRAWEPDGVSTRQHNEPAGSQHVWHYHQHVLPRWHNDGFYFTPKRPIVDPAVRARKAAELRAALGL